MPVEVERLTRHTARSLPAWRANFGLPQMSAILSLVALLASCTQTKPQTAMSAHVDFPSSIRILLLEPDIEVSELTAGGNVLPNAAWTQQAKDNVGTALNHLMATRNAVIVPYSSPDVVDPYDDETQLLKLHSAVGASILFAPAIPRRKDRFDWGLGPDVRMLGDAYDAHYALFVFFRDSFATAGRKVIQFMAAFAGYHGVSGGSQFGFASLVDLKTGQVVWFNQFRRGSGDLRDISPARDATEDLLAEFPIPRGNGVVTQTAVKTSSTVQGQETANVGQPTAGAGTESAAITTPDLPEGELPTEETWIARDGTWVLDIREPNLMPSSKSVVIDVVDGRFSANVSKDGWNGVVSGEIDQFGHLVGTAYLRSPTRMDTALFQWSSEPLGNGYHAIVPASTQWTTMTFEVFLYRTASQ